MKVIDTIAKTVTFIAALIVLGVIVLAPLYVAYISDAPLCVWIVAAFISLTIFSAIWLDLGEELDGDV